MDTISKVSAKTGIQTETIRYYERIGLIPKPSRQANGYRLYGEADLERLNFIRSARALNFSLQEIAQILASRDRHEPPCKHVMDLIQSHIDEVEKRIRELQQLKGELVSLYTAGQDLPEDVQMRSCVCHLIQISETRKGT
jgi:DNA-binding transcriptional MerR regulator